MDPIGTYTNPHVHVDHPEADALTARLVALARRGRTIAAAAIVIAGIAVADAAPANAQAPSIMRHDGR